MDKIQYSKFVVGKVPYCVWEWDLLEKNIEFLNGIEPAYFEHMAKLNADLLDGEERQFAAMAIRMAYCHGLETFFALLGATIQAPDCVVGWLQKYQLKQLRRIVEGISKRNKTILRKLDIDVSWNELSNSIHQFKLEDEDKEFRIKSHFGKLWQRLASDFLSENLIAEYNSIKHGFRVRPGGFSMAIGAQDTAGVPAPTEKMVSLGGSKFGSQFFLVEHIGGDQYKRDPNFRVRRTNLNWNPESLAIKLNLISLSIGNVLSFLKIANGVDPVSVQFKWPDNEDYFEKPWKTSSGVTSGSFDLNIHEDDINRFSKNEILRAYERNNI